MIAHQMVSTIPATPPSTLTSVSPIYGSRTGGTSITVTGTNFVSGDVPQIGGVSCTGVTVVNSTTITATTPNFVTGGVQDAAKNLTILRGGVTNSTLTSAFFTWKPSDYSSLSGAFMPEDIIKSGSNLSSWTNQGSGGAVTSTVSSTPPTVITSESTLNNRSCISFASGSSEWLKLALTSFATTNQIEVFQVISAASFSGGPLFLVGCSATETGFSAADGIDELYAPTTTNLETYRNGSFGNLSGLSTGATMALHTRWFTDGANDGNITRLNGSESTKVDRTGNTNMAITRLLLGASMATADTPGSPFATYKCAALMIANTALSSANRTVVLNFLGWYFNVTA